MAAEGRSKSLSCENLQNIKVGEGQLGEGELLIPEGMRTETANLSDLVDAVFPSITTRFNDASWVGKRAIISPSNMEVAEVNSAVLQRLPGDEVLLKSIDTTVQRLFMFWPITALADSTLRCRLY